MSLILLHMNINTFLVVEYVPTTWILAGAKILSRSPEATVRKEFTNDDFPTPMFPTKSILYLFFFTMQFGRKGSFLKVLEVLKQHFIKLKQHLNVFLSVLQS